MGHLAKVVLFEEDIKIVDGSWTDSLVNITIACTTNQKGFVEQIFLFGNPFPIVVYKGASISVEPQTQF